MGVRDNSIIFTDKWLLSSPRFILGLILVLAFGIRIYNLNFNSPFLDEAIYIVLGKEILGGQIHEVVDSISWVGGFPFFYPFVASIFFSAGGILATRFLGVILGTVAAFLIFHFTKQLYFFKKEKTNEIAGLATAAFLATSAIPIALSRLAIYDILSFTLFLTALISLQKAVFSGRRYFYLATAVILFLAFLAKYVVAIYFPFLLLLILFLATRTKEKRAIAKILRYFLLPLIFLTFLYAALSFSSLMKFLSSQVENSTPSQVFETFWEYSSLAYFISFGGIILLSQKRRIFIIGVLLVFSLLPLVVHLLTGNSLSAHQHSFLSLMFILPIAGEFFASIIQRYAKIGVLITLIAVFFNLLNSFPKVRELESFWPDSDNAVTFLQDSVAVNDKIFAEASAVASLALYEKLPHENIIGPFVFDYQGREGQEAYKQAFADGYFDFVQFDGVIFSTQEREAFEQELLEKYSLAFDDGAIKVYQLKSE